jgi:hypothetical protein
MRVAALGLAAAAALALTPSVATAPPAPVGVVPIVVSHPTGPPDRAHGFVAGNGLVVTVAHVLGGRVTVGGRRASVARVDRRLDLAVLRVPGVRGERPRLAENADANTVLGRPAPVVRRIAARVDGGPARPALRADVSPGDSGAPLVTSIGRVAGVVFARSSSRPSTAYAVDASAVAQMLR